MASRLDRSLAGTQGRRGSRHAKPVAGTVEQFVGGTMQLLEASGDQVATDHRRMRGVLYSGAVVPRIGYRLVIDTASMKLPSNPIPWLFEHGMCENPEMGVIDQVRIEDNAVIVEGDMILSTEYGERVSALWSKGFPYQMSLRVDFTEEPRYIPAGQSVTINGRTIPGPVYAAFNTSLREASTVLLGADGNTNHELMSSLGLGDDDHGGLSMFDTLTIDELKTARPDLVNAIAAAAKEPPATIAQLKALKGADNAFILAQLEAGATVTAATAALSSTLSERLAAAERDKDLAVEAARKEADARVEALQAQLDAALAAAGDLPIRKGPSPAPTGVDPKAGDTSRFFAGCKGKDPDEDWTNSEELRKRCDNDRDLFDRTVRSFRADGLNWALRW